MLDLLFGFNTRLKRLQYLLACIALVVALFAISLALAASGSIHIPRGSHFTWQLSNWPVAAAVALFVLAVVSIQAMRVRDIRMGSRRRDGRVVHGRVRRRHCRCEDA